MPASATAGAIGVTGSPAASSASMRCMTASCTCMRRVKPTVWSVPNHDQAGSSSALAANCAMSASVSKSSSAITSAWLSGRANGDASMASASSWASAPVARIRAQNA